MTKTQEDDNFYIAIKPRQWLNKSSMYVATFQNNVVTKILGKQISHCRDTVTIKLEANEDAAMSRHRPTMSQQIQSLSLMETQDINLECRSSI